MSAELLDAYRSKAVLCRDTLLFPSDVAFEVLNHCEREQVRILGCDGFEPPRGDVIQRSLEDCLDLSTKEHWDYSIPELCDVVRDYIRARGGKFFEFVLP
jgi:hypothetical protein